MMPIGYAARSFSAALTPAWRSHEAHAAKKSRAVVFVHPQNVDARDAALWPSRTAHALHSARQRSVLVRLILESTADSAGALTHDGATAFESLRDSVELYVWPIDKRPAGSRLHAKVAVADGKLAFVTSANLTGHALDQNLEVGVLISGGQTPRRLMEHFHALISKVTLAQL